MKQIISMCLMLVIYGAPWCGYCHQQMDTLDAAKIAYSYVDCTSTKCPYFVTSYPTIMNDHGAVHRGYLNEQEIKEFINSHSREIS